MRRTARNFFLSPISIQLLTHGNSSFTVSSISIGATFSPPAVMISSAANQRKPGDWLKWHSQNNIHMLSTSTLFHYLCLDLISFQIQFLLLNKFVKICMKIKLYRNYQIIDHWHIGLSELYFTIHYLILILRQVTRSTNTRICTDYHFIWSFRPPTNFLQCPPAKIDPFWTVSSGQQGRSP